MRYTARQGGSQLRQAAIDWIADLVKQADTSGLVQLFSLRHDFAPEWQRFLNSDQDFRATVKKEYFPYFVQDSDVTITAAKLFAIIQGDELVAGDSGPDVEALSELSEELNGNGEFALTLSEDQLVKRDKDARVFIVFHYTLQ